LSMAAAASPFTGGVDASSDSIPDSFSKVTNDVPEDTGCDARSIGGVAVTIAPSSDGSATIYATPSDYADWQVVDEELVLYFNEDYAEYKGEAGVYIEVPPQSITEVDFCLGAVVQVLGNVTRNDELFYVKASLGADIYVSDLLSADLEVEDASTNALVVVTFSEDATGDDRRADIDAATTGGSVFISGAYTGVVDDVETGAFVAFLGSELDRLQVSKASTGGAVYGGFAGANRGTVISDSFSTNARVIIEGSDDLSLGDGRRGGGSTLRPSTGATVITDRQVNCDEVSDVKGLICTVDKNIDTPTIPDYPTSFTMDVDNTEYTCIG